MQFKIPLKKITYFEETFQEVPKFKEKIHNYIFEKRKKVHCDDHLECKLELLVQQSKLSQDMRLTYSFFYNYCLFLRNFLLLMCFYSLFVVFKQSRRKYFGSLKTLANVHIFKTD